MSLAGPLVWILFILFEAVPPSGGAVSAMAVASAEFNTRDACERAAGTVRWQHRDRRDLRLSFACAAKE